jgi:hypothetical protein
VWSHDELSPGTPDFMQPRRGKVVRQSMGGVRERPFQPDSNPGSLPCALTAVTHSAPSKAIIIMVGQQELNKRRKTTVAFHLFELTSLIII